MKNLKKMFIAVIVLILAACGSAGPSAEEKSAILDSKEYAYTDSVSIMSQSVSSTAAQVNKDTSRKFIRTADLKFKVNNVRTSTSKIEDVVAHFEGFVTYTNLSSMVERTTVIPVSNDSSVESTYYTVQNDMIIRIPNEQLDTVLKTMAQWIDYLDYRIIKADDVTLSLLANKLSQKRIKQHESRLVNAIDGKGRKLNETVNAEENLLNKQLMADETVLSNLKMQDNIEYSTINIHMYQRMTIDRELIKNDKNMEAYKPGFLHEAKDALKTGWTVLEFILVLLIKLWPMLLIGGIVYVIIKKYVLKK